MHRLSYLCLSLRFHSAGCFIFLCLSFADEAVAVAAEETRLLDVHKKVETDEIHQIVDRLNQTPRRKATGAEWTPPEHQFTATRAQRLKSPEHGKHWAPAGTKKVSCEHSPSPRTRPTPRSKMSFLGEKTRGFPTSPTVTCLALFLCVGFELSY